MRRPRLRPLLLPATVTALAAPLVLAAPGVAAASTSPLPAQVAPSVPAVQPAVQPAGSLGADPLAPSQRRAVARAAAAAEPSAYVKKVQQHLTWAGVYTGAVDGINGSRTKEAVRRFQGKFGLVVDGIAGPKTLAKLQAIAPDGYGLDKRCKTTGKVICIDKTQKITRAVYKGKIVQQYDARFGRPGLRTVEGSFKVYWKSRNHHSRTYDAPMPFALFFYRGQAVHYSPDFVRSGYRGSSHGCVNLRTRSGAETLFDWTPEGTRVVIYWS